MQKIINTPIYLINKIGGMFFKNPFTYLKRKTKLTMNHYFHFVFELGYGDGLPVILPIQDAQIPKIKALLEKQFSDDEYISFDENYVSVNSVIDSAKLITTTEPLPLETTQDWIEKILEFAEEPIPSKHFETETGSEPKTLQKQYETVYERGFYYWLNTIERYQHHVDTGMMSEAEAIQRLNQDSRIFSDLEDMKASLALFGYCVECDSIKTEEGCLTCQSYGED